MERASQDAAREGRAKALSLVVVAALAFSTASPLAKAARGVDPLAIAAVRTLVASAVIFAAMPLATLRALAALAPRMRFALAGAGALLALHFGLYLAGLAATSLAAAVALVSLEPLSVVVVAWMLFGVRPTRHEGLGVLVATAGALVVASSAGQGEHRLAGDAMVLGAVVVFGFYVAAARGLRETMPAVPYAGAVYAICTLCLLPLAAVRPLAAASPSTWLVLVLLGLVPTLVGHTLVQTAARKLPPAVVAMVSPGETLGSLVIGAAAMGLPPTPREAAGAALVLAGAVLAAWR